MKRLKDGSRTGPKDDGITPLFLTFAVFRARVYPAQVYPALPVLPVHYPVLPTPPYTSRLVMYHLCTRSAVTCGRDTPGLRGLPKPGQGSLSTLGRVVFSGFLGRKREDGKREMGRNRTLIG